MTSSDIIQKIKTVRPIRTISRFKIVSTVAQGNLRASVLPTAGFLGDAEGPTSSRWCADHCRDSCKDGDHQGVACQSMI